MVEELPPPATDVQGKKVRSATQMLSSRGRSSCPVGLDHPLAVVELHLTAGTGSMGVPTTDDAMATVNGSGRGTWPAARWWPRAVCRVADAGCGWGGGRGRCRSSAAVAVCGVRRVVRRPVVGGTVRSPSPRLCARTALPPAPRPRVSTRGIPSVMAQAPRHVRGRPRRLPTRHGRRRRLGGALPPVAAWRRTPTTFSPPWGAAGRVPRWAARGWKGREPTLRRWGSGLVPHVPDWAPFTVSWVSRRVRGTQRKQIANNGRPWLDHQIEI